MMGHPAERGWLHRCPAHFPGLLLALLRPGDPFGPSASVLRVTRAVEAESSAALRARLRSSLRRTPTDRTTLFELATLERLTYHPMPLRPLFLAFSPAIRSRAIRSAWPR